MSYRALFLIATALFLAACGMSEETFAEKAATLSCERTEECSGGLITCTVTEPDEGEEEEYECDYDRKKAKECLDYLETATCEELALDGNTVCDEARTCR